MAPRRPSRRFCQRTIALTLTLIVCVVAIPDAMRFDLAIGAEAEDRVAELDWLDGAHRLRLVERSDDAFHTRVAMIRGASDTIDISSFIWRDDGSGRELFGELVSAAERGVQIRVLGDAVFFLRDPDQLAAMAAAEGNLALRLHNPVDGQLAAVDLGSLDDLALEFKQVNRRMHLKLLITDQEQVLLGGRNVGDEYFGRHAEINFIDRDAVIEGPLVAHASRCFERYWQHPDSIDPTQLGDLPPSAADAVWPRAEFDRDAIGDDWWEPQRLALWYDDPDADGLARSYDPGVLANRLAALLGTARDSLLIESPYLILSERSRQLLEELRAAQPQLTITCITNSLAATDNWQAYTAMFTQLRELLGRHRMRIYAHRPEAYAHLAGGAVGTSSIHAKTFVVDRRYAALGSFNFDPRSGYWNDELLVVIDDPMVVAAVAHRVEAHMDPSASWVIAERERSVAMGLADTAMAAFSGWVSELIALDLWPLINHDYYEHVSGEPVPADHPRFGERYRSVGPAPGVALDDARRLKMRLLRSLGEAAAPTL